MMQHTITIEPTGKIIRASAGESLKSAVEKAGYIFPMNCNGMGTCSNCRVQFLSPSPKMKSAEKKMFGGKSPYRMACMHTVESDCTITLPLMTEMINIKSITEIDLAGGKDGYGLGVDLGTTTVALYFIDRQSGTIMDQFSFLNPQNALGGDVMTRLKVAARGDGLQELRKLIMGVLNRSITKILKKHSLRRNAVKEIIVAGNTVMTHLFLGINTSGLEGVPFKSLLQGHDWLAFDPGSVGLSTKTQARVFPVLSGFIGGDTAAGILACGLDHKKGVSLLIDLGTNGEIVLARDGVLYATSAAAGPAFDGMGMYSGMPALPGAIEGISGEGQPLTIGHKDVLGICGSGYIALMAHMLSHRLVDYTGLLQNTPAGKPYWSPISPRSKVRITQEDIRKFQLAKGAISAGIEILCHEAQIDFTRLEQIIVTGSFGNSINLTAAMQIGLIPRIPEERVFFIDNAAGRGAVLSLGDSELFERVREFKNRLKVINLADHPHFQDIFARGMLFPSA